MTWRQFVLPEPALGLNECDDLHAEPRLPCAYAGFWRSGRPSLGPSGATDPLGMWNNGRVGISQ